MFDSPRCAPLSGTVCSERWRGLTAPPADSEEHLEALLKGMSGKPEEFFKVERWSYLHDEDASFSPNQRAHRAAALCLKRHTDSAGLLHCPV